MSAAILAVALVLDALFGEPRWLWSRIPHPAVVMGRAVSWLETRLNRSPARMNGVFAVALLVGGAGGLGFALSHLGPVADGILVAILLAQKSLVDHVRAVATGLHHSVEAGRKSVALIVSRETGAMDESAVSRSALESLAENFSDGVIAPAFWYLVAGLPGILIYKTINTADSTVGYRTPRFEHFGWAAARLDDVLNWIPARLTALILFPSLERHTWSRIRSDARLHKSPNAGWPEAALAHHQGVALAGPRIYDGILRDLAWVNEDGRRDLGPAEIERGIAIVWNAWRYALAVICLVAILGIMF